MFEIVLREILNRVFVYCIFSFWNEFSKQKFCIEDDMI